MSAHWHCQVGCVLTHDWLAFCVVARSGAVSNAGHAVQRREMSAAANLFHPRENVSRPHSMSSGDVTVRWYRAASLATYKKWTYAIQVEVFQLLVFCCSLAVLMSLTTLYVWLHDLMLVIVLLYCWHIRYLDRIIKSNELQEFSELLQTHQRATTSDGMTWQPHFIFLCYLFIVSARLYVHVHVCIFSKAVTRV